MLTFLETYQKKKQDNVGISTLFKDGKLESDSKSKAEILLEQFSSVFIPQIAGPMPPVKKTCRHSLLYITINIKGTESLLNK